MSLPAFQGPLDLLLHLIEEQKIDIWDIPIARITQQYLDHISAMEWVDVDQAADFLVMAATLMQIKARMLLPPDPEGEEAAVEGAEEEDPRTELVQRLLEYRRFKQAAEALRLREDYWSRVYLRPPSPPEPFAPEGSPLEGVTVEGLFQAFLAVLESLPEEEFSQVPQDEIPIKEIMAEISYIVSSRGRCKVQDILASARSRGEVVTAFLAVLELMRLGRIRAFQPKTFGDIYIVWAGGQVSLRQAAEGAEEGGGGAET